MAEKRLGQQTLQLSHPPRILGRGSCVGKKEGVGPLGRCFDQVLTEDSFGRSSWEKAERAMLGRAVELALEKAGLSASSLDFFCAGDLLNQCISAGYTARDLASPYLGLYGACSTMGEGLALAAMAIDGGFADHVCAAACSHFCTAERQYRTPLEYGGQRTPTAQWTVTGAGAVILARHGNGPGITHATAGRVIDPGIRDTNNMGAAMAPVDVKLAP